MSDRRMLLLLLFQVCDLGDPDPDVRERATAALRNAGARAVPALVKALKSSDQEVVSRADELLDRLADAASLRDLRIRLEDVETDGVRANGRVIVENAGRLPLRIDLMHVDVENLKEDPRPSGVHRMLPGQTIEVRVSGRLTASNPRPTYAGVVIGDRVAIEAPPETMVRIVRLKCAQARAMKDILDDVFRLDVPVVEITADARTNALILRGRQEYLDLAGDVIDALDRD